MKLNEENHEEPDNNNIHLEEDEFKKVPIENSLEIINIINNLNRIAKEKFKKKFFKRALIVIVIIIFLILTKRMIYDGVIKLIYYDKDINNYTNNDENDEESFYIKQNKTKNFESFASPQLRNVNNIKIIEKLKIRLSLEYKNYVHFKIKDLEKKRWEIPEDIFNEEYLANKTKNTKTISKFSELEESEDFYIEYISRKKKEYDDDLDVNMDLNDDNHIIFDDEFSFKLMTKDHKEFFYFNSSEQFLYSDNFINFQTRLSSNKIYGFGERTHDFQLDEGIYTTWTTDYGGTLYDDGLGGMKQYSHQPIGLHKTRYPNLWLGFVFLNTNEQDIVINLNKQNESEVLLTYKTIGGIIDYYIIVDNSPENIVRKIQFLLGIPTLPPYWSLGNHQTRYGLKTFDEFRNIYNNYKKYEIPIDIMWTDIDTMDNFEIFTLNQKFQRLSSFVKDVIHMDGGKYVPIIDMGLSYENKNNSMVQFGDSLDIFIKSNYTKDVLIGKVWAGKTVFPDFLNPKVDIFWKKGLSDYHKIIEYDGIWLDMNEPANLLKNGTCKGEIIEDSQCTKDKNKYNNEDLPYWPGYREREKDDLSYGSISENALLYGNNTVYDAKVLLGYYENKITYEYLQNELNVRPFILSRSTTLGSGKYSFHWLGDNASILEHIKSSISGIFNFNIFGIPFSGADICGFKYNATKYICIRWYNLGVFYPFMRNHNSKKSSDQFPWSFNDSSEYNSISIIKNNINLRYSLLRYMYSQLFLISLNEKGSFFKPIMFEFPEEEISFNDIESRIMFGEAFLICTFYNETEDDREFEIPKAHFNKYPQGSNIINFGEENRKIKLSGKLDEIHIFLRGGFIIPYQNTSNKYILNTMKLREEPLNLIVNIDDLKQAKGVIFFDNDEADTIKSEKYIRVDLIYNKNKITIKTKKNKLDKYNFNDHFLNSIEIWRLDEILELDKNKEEIKIKINLVFLDYKKKKIIIEAPYNKEMNKAIFTFPTDKSISIFDIKEILIK